MGGAGREGGLGIPHGLMYKFNDLKGTMTSPSPQNPSLSFPDGAVPPRPPGPPPAGVTSVHAPRTAPQTARPLV